MAPEFFLETFNQQNEIENDQQSIKMLPYTFTNNQIIDRVFTHKMFDLSPSKYREDLLAVSKMYR